MVNRVPRSVCSLLVLCPLIQQLPQHLQPSYCLTKHWHTSTPAPGAPKGPVSRVLVPGFCRNLWVGSGVHFLATTPVRPDSVREAGRVRVAKPGWSSRWPLRNLPPDLTLWVFLFLFFFSSRPHFCIGVFSVHLICFLPGPAVGSGCQALGAFAMILYFCRHQI